MEQSLEKYLPIGSIVLLKGGKKRLMITGFCALPNGGQNKTYDYSGCLYPEGIISSDQVALFDHNQIEHVFSVGYSDEEEKQFKNNLKQTLAKLGKDGK